MLNGLSVGIAVISYHKNRQEILIFRKQTSAGLSQNKIAKAMGLDSKTFSFKMNGVTDWKLKEIQYLQKVLNIDVCKVFCFQNKMER